MPNSDLPPVTDDHRRYAFQMLCIKETTFERAMEDQFQRRLIDACASQLRTMDWQRSQCRARNVVRRVVLDENGNQIGWRSQVVRGLLQPIVQPDLLN